ncbi:molybdenum cofactor guanylyltransferase MobA [Mesorhizobium sp. IMUNJ 23232]|uniref:molybdenum cofactor guanylyltransferase MobA n=1 Tax=Mesorhizobium sp. IMUNJ 23232 TaxID=3376064 RepID=UPI0037B069FA
MTTASTDIAGLILCGGRSSRMGGGDKSLLPLGSSTILARIISRLGPIRPLAISANGDAARFSAFALPVLADTIPGYAGPLAGILAGMHWAAGQGREYLLTVAGDTPFFPTDLAGHLATAVAGLPGRIAVASSNGRRHPVFALWPTALRHDLGRFLVESGTGRVNTFIDLHDPVDVAFPLFEHDGQSIDPFFNINVPADLAEAERIAQMLDP